jgi:hypothetical protein
MNAWPSWKPLASADSGREPIRLHMILIDAVYPQAKLLSNKLRMFIDECVAKLRAARFD